MFGDASLIGLDFNSALPSRRRAVLFADLVESVRLFGQFERQVIERWHAFVRTAVEEIAPAFHGRVVRTAGDGLLLEFEQLPKAAEAALAMHAELAKRNLGQPVSITFRLRIGIHLADVVSFEHELYGAGVNIAARLASLAQPDQTLLSASARQELADGVHGRIHDLGLRFVKHLDQPLRVFRLDSVDALGGDQVFDICSEDLRPTLAIIPLVASPADAEHDALGHALADDLIASLSRHPELRVLARASTAMVRGNDPSDLSALRNALGASFLLTGRFYVLNRQVRVSFELSELQKGMALWSGRATGNVAEVFQGSDDLVPHVVAEVSRHILGHELSRARSLPVDVLSSYSLFVGASGLLNSLVRRDVECARLALEHLVERHPRHAAPLALLARWPVLALEQGWIEDRGQAAVHARELCERALDRDPANAAAHAALAMVCSNFEGNLEEARELNLRATQLNPSDALAWAQWSGNLAFLNEGASACAAVGESLRLSPLDPCRYLYESYAALAHIAAGNADQAVLHATNSVRQHCLHGPGLHLLVGALWLAGQFDEARQAARRYLGLFPRACAGPTAKRRLGHGLAWRAQFEEALIEAGIPP